MTLTRSSGPVLGSKTGLTANLAPRKATRDEFGTGPENRSSAKQDQRADLSALLGLEVVSVARSEPGRLVASAGGRWETEQDAFGRPVKQRWWVRLRLGDGRDYMWSPLSEDIRGHGREVSRLLRALGSSARLDNRECRSVLRLLHEVIEQKAGQ